ncbi:unnamed protein product [Discula destructiva]
MADKNLSQLLKWSIEAQTAGDTTQNADGTTTTNPQPKSQLTPEILAAIMGGPSDAELMVQSMAAITSAATPEDEKLVAFDNFEQLIESLDNANNMATLALWPPLLAQLESPAPELRRYAAWCVGTAVQNNEKSQAALLPAAAPGALARLVGMALDGGEETGVRRKAVYALSSACRNYQPAMDAVAEELVNKGVLGEGKKQVDAADMEAVDEVMNPLKEKISKDAEEKAAA